MRNTIRAQQFYQVRRSKTNQNFCGVYDGNELLFAAERRTIQDYKDEKETNEFFVKHEVFTTRFEHQFIYWVDSETGEDFLTEVS